MKEFEKHDKEYCDRETSHNCLNIDIYCEHCAELRKIGWRAALEWVLTHKQKLLFAKEKDGDASLVSYVETPFIAKELEDENT